MGLGRAPQHPRVRHLHIIVDDLPSWWADASHNNTVKIAGQQPGQHSETIALFDANHNPFPGQVVTVTFTVPSSASKQHTHMHSDEAPGSWCRCYRGAACRQHVKAG